jgi:hypothetical protein
VRKLLRQRDIWKTKEEMGVIKTDLKEMRFEEGKWMELAEDRVKLRDLILRTS